MYAIANTNTVRLCLGKEWYFHFAADITEVDDEVGESANKGTESPPAEGQAEEGKATSTNALCTPALLITQKCDVLSPQRAKPCQPRNSWTQNFI